MAGVKLAAENALITTATVEVKVLKIGKQKVTLSVFRQLDEGQATLDDQIWGRVNYCPEQCAFGEHLHFVWQRDGVLRRGTVYRPMHPADGHDMARKLPKRVNEGEFWEALFERGFGDYEIYTTEDSRISAYGKIWFIRPKGSHLMLEAIPFHAFMPKRKSALDIPENIVAIYRRLFDFEFRSIADDMAYRNALFDKVALCEHLFIST